MKNLWEADVIYYESPDFPCVCGSIAYRFVKATQESFCQLCDAVRTNRAQQNEQVSDEGASWAMECTCGGEPHASQCPANRAPFLRGLL